ncbi:MAG: hypothetical protein K2V38_15750 [Gemmataceae bacterium]|nr:hypothetical protein [Gemmataceae bacterium]
MVAATEPLVEIDDRIRANPELLAQVNSALAYLGRHIDGVPLPAAIRWRPLPLDPSSVELVMSDTADYSDLTARHMFLIAEMADDYTREVGTLQTWRRLLRQRSRRNWVRIDELARRVAEADDEGADDESVTDAK